MATTTTNFGWDIPQSTDLVKDGATAIAALGQDIDTAFVDFKGGTTGQVLKKTSGTDLDVEWGTASSGLTLINTTSFSAVASQSFNDVFSTTYENYAIKFSNFSFSLVDQLLNLRLRVSSADNSTSNYSLAFIRNIGSTVTGGQTHNGTAYNRLAYSSVVGASPMNLEIVSPFATAKTYFSNTSFQPASTTNNGLDVVTGFFNATTSFTGFTIYPDSGTITGTVSIYGYSK